MDFQQLLAKMQQLDQPVGEECGMPPPSMSTMGAQPPMDQPPPAHPSLSINLNAQGIDNIEQIMKLVAKVNPEMEKPAMPPLPSLSPEPSIMSIKPPMPGIGDLGNLDAGPLKMLPDLDSEPEGDHPEPDADNFGGPSDNDADNKIDIIQKSIGDMDGDGDKDMDADDEEDDDEEKEKKDEWANGLTGHDDVEYKGMDAAVPDGNDLNKPKGTYPKVAGGDNPMQKTESTDLRSQIRAELLKRLNEAKGVK